MIHHNTETNLHSKFETHPSYPFIGDILEDISQKLPNQEIDTFQRTGGRTNLNFKLTTSLKKEYALKKLSRCLPEFINREHEESVIQHLSEIKLYPAIIHLDPVFRIEQYIVHNKISKPEFYENELLRNQLAALMKNVHLQLSDCEDKLFEG